MKQPQIELRDIHGKHYGMKKITTCYWSRDGELVGLEVDFAGSTAMGKWHLDIAPLKNQFTNIHGNLIGTLKEE